MSDTRCYENLFGDYDGIVKLVNDEGKLSGELTENIRKFLVVKMEQILHVIERKKIDFGDSSVYTGLTGLVMLFWKISLSQYTGEETKKEYTEFCINMLSTARNEIRGKRVTFLCGDSGVLAMSALLVKNNSARYIDEVKEISKLLSDDKLPDELLFGKSGYLHSLLFIKKHFKTKLDDGSLDELIRKIAQLIITQGKKDCKQEGSSLPLYYAWHGKEYMGAAHGYIGILYTLLQTKILVPDSITASDDATMKKCLYGLLDQRYLSGNIRSSMGSETDKLIHWCHGAPGAVHLYAMAYKIYGDSKYLDAARLFGDVIWSRGLLKKGYGICHGVAGNAYGLLCLYQLTKNKSYLWKATKFTEWCLAYGQHGCKMADRPYSLFEGLAGTLYFLHDMLNPDDAAFPAFQLISYD